MSAMPSKLKLRNEAGFMPELLATFQSGREVSFRVPDDKIIREMVRRFNVHQKMVSALGFAKAVLNKEDIGDDVDQQALAEAAVEEALTAAE